MTSRQGTVHRVVEEKLMPIVRGDRAKNLLLADGPVKLGPDAPETMFGTKGAMDVLRQLRDDPPGRSVDIGNVRGAELVRDAAAEFAVRRTDGRGIVDAARDAAIARNR